MSGRKLPGRATQRTAPGSAWWQAFAVYDVTVGHITTLRVGTPPEPERRAYLSPVAEARRYQTLLENDPSIETRTDVARELGVSKARVTQVLGLLKLAPAVQNALLALRDQRSLRHFSERRLRPLMRISHPKKQVRAFRQMLAAAPR